MNENSQYDALVLAELLRTGQPNGNDQIYPFLSGFAVTRNVRDTATLLDAMCGLMGGEGYLIRLAAVLERAAHRADRRPLIHVASED